MNPLLLSVVIPVLIQEGASVVKQWMKERRKERMAAASQEAIDLRQRIEQLELQAKWS